MFRRRRERRRLAAEAASASVEAESQRQQSAFSVEEEDETRFEEARLAEEARRNFCRDRGFGEVGEGVDDWSTPPPKGQQDGREDGGGEGGGEDEREAMGASADDGEGGVDKRLFGDDTGDGDVLSSSTASRTASFQSERSSCKSSFNESIDPITIVEPRLEKGDHVYRRSKGGLAQVHGIVVSCAPDEDGPLVIADFTGRGYERAVSKSEMKKMKEEVERERKLAEEEEERAKREEEEREALPWGGKGCAVPVEEAAARPAADAEGDGDGKVANGGVEKETKEEKVAEADGQNQGKDLSKVDGVSEGDGTDGNGVIEGDCAVAKTPIEPDSRNRKAGGEEEDDDDNDGVLRGPQESMLSASERHDLTQEDDEEEANADESEDLKKSSSSGTGPSPPIDEENSRIRIVAIHGKKNIRKWKKVKYGSHRKKASNEKGGGGGGGWFRRSSRTKPTSPMAEADASMTTTHRKKTKDEQLPGSDPAALVVSRVMFLLERQDLLPPRHALLSNSECISVWCKTGRWSTFQVSAYLCATWGTQSKAAFTMAAFASSQTVTVPAAGYMGWLGYTTAVPLVAVHPLILPAIAGYGVVSVGVPLYMLRKCGRKWDKTTMLLNEKFWENAGNEVFVECVRHWSGLED